MTLIEMLRANGSWEADAAAARIEKLEAENAELQSKVNTVRLAAKYAAKIRDGRIEKLEAALRWIVEQEKQTAHPTVCAIVRTARKALEIQTYGGQQDDSALKADHPIALSAEDIRKMNHE